MKDFRRPSGQGAGRTGGFEKREGGSEFRPRSSTYENRDHSSGGYKGSRGDNRGTFPRDREETLHKATCAECNKTCEVPFRPNGKKPVYCKDCFGAKKTPGGNANRFEKSEYTPRESAPYVREDRRDREQSHSQAAPVARDSRVDELKAQVDALNTKLDRVLKALEHSSAPAAPQPVEKKPYVAASAAPTLNVAMKEMTKPVSKPAVKAVTAKKPAKVAPAAKKAEVKAAPVKKPAAAKVAPKAKPVTKKKK